MRIITKFLSIAVLSLLALQVQAAVKVRLKDILYVEGVRSNQLVGYGLVVGLNGTGDDTNSSPYARESLVGMLERLGVNVRDQATAIKTKNVAAVMVTASLPPFKRHGSTIDINVSAIGNAKSLLGGTLLVTPMLGADSEIYAVAQGSVVVGGFSAQGEESQSSVTQNVPTSGVVTNGAIIEREIGFEFNDMKNIRLNLRNPDFTTARRVAAVINQKMGNGTARAVDNSTITLSVPGKYRQDLMGFITDIEQLTVEPDQVAKVIIDEQNGIVVMGAEVKISTVAVSHGNLTIRITETPQVSQPAPFATTGVTTTVQRTLIEVDDDSEKVMTVLPGNTSLQDLVNSLNALGIPPRDMITILRTIKAAGALQADIKVIG